MFAQIHSNKKQEKIREKSKMKNKMGQIYLHW